VIESRSSEALLLAIGAELERHRRGQRLSQASVARKANLSHVTVSQIERCRDMKISTLVQVAHALGCVIEIKIVRSSK
jgi:transcriptional regulator with XRE-family HTH domain